MSNLFKSTSLLILLIALNFFAITVAARAQDEKKEAADKKEQQKTQQQEQQVKEDDIQPPEGEQWVAPGDDELYKFDIKPITPKEGITGGVLIYYGHYIRPPYKVETKPFIKDGEIVGAEVIVNGLLINPVPEVIKRKFFIEKPKFIVKRTEYEKECLKKEDVFIKSIEKDLKKIVDKTGLKKENIKKLEIEFEKYYKTKPEIVSFEMDSIWSVKIIFKICLEQSEELIFNWGWNKTTEEQYIYEKESWNKLLQMKGHVEYVEDSGFVGSNREELDRLALILESPKNPEEKIKHIYKLGLGIRLTKFIYHNFDYREYLKDRRSGFIK